MMKKKLRLALLAGGKSGERDVSLKGAEEVARALDPDTKIISVNEILCEGCGACAAACPSGAAQQRNQTDEQIFSMLKAMLKG